MVLTTQPSTSQREIFQPSINRTRPYYKLWGTRGSIPVSGSRYLRHGGNTPCLEINDGENTIIIDAGTGIRDLGVHLAAQNQHVIHLFIGHTHWDHIQGFPFFIPAYNPLNKIIIYGSSGFGKDLKSVFRGQLDADYFPVQLQDLLSSIDFIELRENPVQIGKIRVHWEYVHHPGATVGFKFEVGSTSVAYLTDNEFLKGYIDSPLNLKTSDEILQEYKSLISFIQDVDILIAESQYPNDEYAKKIGWGHTALSNGCLLCKLGAVKRWIVTHHDPMHDDEFLENKLLLTKQILAQINYPIPVSHAYDGMVDYF